jgi:putative addiction module component (TIGR02574 family)
MSIATIRQKLHNYLEVADDKKVKAIYTMMEAEIEENELVYTTELKDELDRRNNDYKSGNAKMLTAEESKKRIQKILNAKKK